MLRFWLWDADPTKSEDDLVKIGSYPGMGPSWRWWEADHHAQQNLSSTSKDMYMCVKIFHVQI